MVKLSERLYMVSSLLDKGNVICDVGCDHAYLPVYLIENGIFNKAIAMDIKKGPLDKAVENIIKYDMESVVETRQSDGVRNLKKMETDAITICGMGGNVMMHIFEDGEDVLRDISQIILQPQSEYMKLYGFLCDNGYYIEDEACTKDSNKFYFAWKIRHAGNNLQMLNDDLINLEFYYSDILLERRDEIYREYLVSYYNSVRKAADNMIIGSPDNYRLDILRKEMETIDRMIIKYNR